MVELTPDIIYDILLRMPLTSLARFRCVCKLWCNYIDDPQFMAKEEHIPIMFHKTKGLIVEGSKKSTTLELKKDMVFEFFYKRKSSKFSVDVVLGSCNGLLLSTQDRRNPFMTFTVIHSLRKECYELPPIKFWSDFPDMRLGDSCGLGFDDSSNTFKIVCVVLRREGFCTMVHDLGTDSWRNIHQVPLYDLTGECVFASGCLYWLTSHDSPTMCLKNVIYFDVKKEEFMFIDPPNRTRDGCVCDQKLVNLNGKVGIVYNVDTRNIPGRIEVWVLKQKEWVMHCVFDLKWPLYYKHTTVIGCWNKGGDILIRVNIGGCRLFVYILEGGVLHEVIGEEIQYETDIQMYRSDFFSLKKTIWGKVVDFEGSLGNYSKVVYSNQQ